MNIIDERHDFELIRKNYAENGLITIDNFLDEKIADSVYSGLKEISSQGLWYQANHGNPKYYKKELIGEEANHFHFSFRYEMYPLKNYTLEDMSKANIIRKDMKSLHKISANPEMELHYSHPLRQIGDFFNSELAHNLISTITGNPLSSEKALCFASRYTADDFLALHDDGSNNNSSPRRVAFVLNMTKDWLLHWGGNLVILNEEYDQIIEAHIPKFNSLVLFDVPLKHAVLPVSCFCQSERFAITGWYQNFYQDDKMDF